jgi:hypothetical protein
MFTFRFKRIIFKIKVILFTNNTVTNIHFQPYDLNIFTKAGKRFVFDVVRKKDVPFTPEELVRQTILHYLIHTRKKSVRH